MAGKSQALTVRMRDALNVAIGMIKAGSQQVKIADKDFAKQLKQYERETDGKYYSIDYGKITITAYQAQLLQKKLEETNLQWLKGKYIRIRDNEKSSQYTCYEVSQVIDVTPKSISIRSIDDDNAIRHIELSPGAYITVKDNLGEIYLHGVQIVVSDYILLNRRPYNEDEIISRAVGVFDRVDEMTILSIEREPGFYTKCYSSELMLAVYKITYLTNSRYALSNNKVCTKYVDLSDIFRHIEQSEFTSIGDWNGKDGFQ